MATFFQSGRGKPSILHNVTNSGNLGTLCTHQIGQRVIGKCTYITCTRKAVTFSRTPYLVKIFMYTCTSSSCTCGTFAPHFSFFLPRFKVLCKTPDSPPYKLQLRTSESSKRRKEPRKFLGFCLAPTECRSLRPTGKTTDRHDTFQRTQSAILFPTLVKTLF